MVAEGLVRINGFVEQGYLVSAVLTLVKAVVRLNRVPALLLEDRRALLKVGRLLSFLGFFLVQELSVERYVTPRLEERAWGLPEEWQCGWLLFDSVKRRLLILDCNSAASL